jgi:hypothetical protein
VCKAITCTRFEAKLLSLPVDVPETGVVGTLVVYQNQEPVDVVHTFCKEHNITEYRHSLLVHICQRITCTRDRAAIFKSGVNDPNGGYAGVLVILEEEEPADAVYKFSKNAGMNDNFKNGLVQHVCSKLNCTRTEALLYQQNIILEDESGQPSSVGILKIFDGQEPIDVIYEFATNRTDPISEGYMQSILGTVCKTVPCTRTVRSVFSKSFNIPGKNYAADLHILYNQEPVDAVYKFLQVHGVSNMYMAGIMEVVCATNVTNVVCAKDRAVKFTANILLPNDTSATLVIYHDEEPADACKYSFWYYCRLFKLLIAYYLSLNNLIAVYDFGKLHNLTNEERDNFIGSVCEHTHCRRYTPSLFTWPVYVENDQYAGTLEILEGEEPVDKVYTFMVKSHMKKHGYPLKVMMDRVCAAPKVTCNNTRPLAVRFEVPNESNTSSILGVETLYGDVEPADFLYEVGMKYNLSVSTRRALLSRVCGLTDKVYCSRPFAKLYSLDALNTTGFGYSCSVVYAKWRWYPGESWIPITNISEYYNKEWKEYLTTDPIVNSWILNHNVFLVYSSITLLCIFYLFICSRITIKVALFMNLPFKFLKDVRKKSLLWASVLVSIPFGSFVYVNIAGNSDAYDHAVYNAVQKIGTVVIYENDNVADAVYDWSLEEDQARKRVVRF